MTKEQGNLPLTVTTKTANGLKGFVVGCLIHLVRTVIKQLLKLPTNLQFKGQHYFQCPEQPLQLFLHSVTLYWENERTTQLFKRCSKVLPIDKAKTANSTLVKEYKNKIDYFPNCYNETPGKIY